MHEKHTGRPERDPFESLVNVLAAANRYDILLALVPIAFAGALVVANVTSVSLVQAMFAAALVGGFAIADACYWNPPIDQGTP